jgi:hypothetical protein
MREDCAETKNKTIAIINKQQKFLGKILPIEKPHTI